MSNLMDVRHNSKGGIIAKIGLTKSLFGLLENTLTTQKYLVKIDNNFTKITSDKPMNFLMKKYITAFPYANIVIHVI